jgi:hypothetical protein
MTPVRTAVCSWWHPLAFRDVLLCFLEPLPSGGGSAQQPLTASPCLAKPCRPKVVPAEPLTMESVDICLSLLLHLW